MQPFDGKKRKRILEKNKAHILRRVQLSSNVTLNEIGQRLGNITPRVAAIEKKLFSFSIS